MSCDFSQTLLIGVKLSSVTSLFYEESYEEYGCAHKVEDHKFCPECGRQAKRKRTREVPKIELMSDDWLYSSEKVIANKYYLLKQDKYSGNDDAVFIGIFKKRERNPGPDIFLPSEEVARIMTEDMPELLSFLEEHNISYDKGSIGVHVIPVVSC